MQSILVKKMLSLELPGKRRRGRPKMRFMDVVREDMRVVGVSDRDTATTTTTTTTTTNILRPFFPLVGVSLLLPMTEPSISLHPLHHFSPNL